MQCVEARQGGCDELIFTRRTRRLHGREDSAAGPGDLFVGGPRKSQLEFVRAIAGVNEVRVTVDQARGDPATVHP